MDLSSTSRVTIIAVGVENYKYLPRLKGTKHDVENFHDLLVSSQKTALYQEKQFTTIIDPTSAELRDLISTYIFDRSALGDILIFYFSGHGTTVGHKDFGFCTIDTRFHSSIQAVLPLTVFRFSELLDSLSIADITPVIIIDACYSGKAGDALVSTHTAINAMQEKIKISSASNHALLCSCSDLQTSIDNPQKGGLFSRGIFEIAKNGISHKKQKPDTIGLQDMYRPLSSFIETEVNDSNPRLYIGETLYEFPLVKNVLYSPQKYSFVGHLKKIINTLWNNGEPRELPKSEILKLCGRGSYGNHNKLSLEPWQLVETAPKSSNRRLTKKGISFAKGKIKIPKSIEKDPHTGKWLPSPGSIEITINDVKIKVH